MMGESKFEVLELVPQEVKPKTLLIKLPASTEFVLNVIRQNNLSLPLIFKPDMGERGWMVRKIKSIADIENYLGEIKIDFIIQELVDLPLEFGVYYLRFPSRQNGFVNSITMKEFLFIEGDGKKNIQELIFEKDRARLQWKTLQTVYQNRLTKVLSVGEKLELVSIGNHCLGTTFLNANQLITPKLSESFDGISKKIKNFYFGRYDLRCGTLQDLENGNIKIVELNGCGAEPAHIYHPGASLWKGIGDLIVHWRNLYQISRENHQLGIAYLSFAEGKAIYKRVKSLKMS